MKRSIKPDRRNKRQMGRTVWTTAFVLMVLLMASIAGVGAVLKPVPTNEKNVIFIAAGASADYMTGTKSITQKGGTDSTGGNGAGTGSYQRAASANPGIIVQDKKVQWETKTDVDLFAKSYINDKNEITVRSGKNDKLIAPGTTGDYAFSLKNTGNVSLEYEMSLDGLFLLKARKLPIQIRLGGDNGRWIVGNDNEWVFSNKWQGVVEEGTLKANQVSNYKLQWRWPYEAGNDQVLVSNDGNDTALGIDATKDDVDFQLTITVRTEVAPDTEPATEPQSQKPGTEPATESESQEPSTEPATESESQEPSTEPATESESQEPGTEPATESESQEPGTEPTTEPESQGPGTEPTTESESQGPGAEPATEPESQEPDTGLITESENRGSENTSEIEIESDQDTQSPQTGDDTNIAAYAVLLLGSCMILVVLISRRRRLLPGKGGHGDEEE